MISEKTENQSYEIENILPVIVKNVIGVHWLFFKTGL